MRRTLNAPLESEYARRSWDRGADEYAAGQASGRDFYRYEFFGPAQIEMCGDVAGLEILDVGCGNGYFARAMADRGARVTGIDFSPRMIAHAERLERERPLGIAYEALDASRLVTLANRSFDMATSCVALQDAPDAGAALREVRRVLRPDGRFVLSISHPCTDTPRRAWTKDGAGHKLWLEIDRYFDRASFEDHWNWGAGFSTASRHAPLEDWFAWIREAGFTVVGLREPRPASDALARRPELEDAARVPYFALFDLVAAAVDTEADSGPVPSERPYMRVEGPDDSSTRSWDAVADDWVAHADTNDYRNHFLLPRTLAMLGDVRGRRILDLGCGEGGYSRALAERGATVTGVDGSAALVETARARTSGLDITYLRANASAMPAIATSSIDLVLASMTLMDVEDYRGAVQEIRRVLVKGGELLMSLTHPCFSTRAARWIRDGAGRPVAFAMDRYFEREAWDDFITPRFRAPVVRRHRPLEDYLGDPLEAGFHLLELREPSATAEEQAHSARFAYLARVPYFLFLKWRR